MHKLVPVFLAYLSVPLLGCSPVRAPAGDGGIDSNVDAGVTDVDAAIVACGDKQVAGNESCDDGNQESGDGCSEVCLDESQNCETAVLGSVAVAQAGRMVADEGFVYLSSRRGYLEPRLQIVDATNPENLQLSGSFAYSLADYPNATFDGIVKRNDELWIAGNDPMLISVRVNDPNNPTRQFIKQGNSDEHLARLGPDHLLISTSVSERPTVYDLSVNPPQTGVMGDRDLVYYNVAASDTHAFATHSTGVDVMDFVDRPMNADIIGRFEYPTNWPSGTAINKMVANDSLLVIATRGGNGGSGAIYLVDVSSPSIPEYITSIDEVADDVLLVDSFLYVPVQDGIKVFDLSTPAEPVLAGRFVSLNLYGYSIATDLDRTYVLGEDTLFAVKGLPGTCEPTCGNNVLEYPEACDDGNHSDGDACNAECTSVP